MNNFNISSYSLGLWRRGFLAAGARGVDVGAGVWDRADSPFLALNRRGGGGGLGGGAWGGCARGLCPKSRARRARASSSEVYPAGKLQ